MKQKTSIILLTSNRKDMSKQTIDGLIDRLVNLEFMHLIVIDNDSKDGTVEMLSEYANMDVIDELILLDEKTKRNIAGAYNLGLELVESEYFLTMQDDIIIPKLEPDVIEQLVDLMEKNPEYGGIGCRIQRIPNMKWVDGDISPARKSLSAYCRIQKKSDMIAVGGFGKRDWDDLSFYTIMTEKLGKKCGWANNLWCNHLGHVPGRGYPEGYVRAWGWDKNHLKTEAEMARKPYPKIDPITNKPLPGEKIFR